MTLNTFSYSLPKRLDDAVNLSLAEWQQHGLIARVWARDATVWTGDDENKWLAWLDVVDEQLAQAQKYRDLHGDIQSAGFTDVLLMGMGGSSLCPEVLAFTFGKTNFHILDSTVPTQIKTVENKLVLTKTLFIVASKSGSTLEPNCFKQYFFERVAEKVGRENAGKQFIAITDPGSKMEQVAKDGGFRHIFYGKPDIGGRFSALSAFGMAAAAAMGMDVEKFLKNASEMVDACRNDNATINPGALLGNILGVCHANGRDKLTIFTSPDIHDLGAWLEQLVAESTGKKGVAIIPVDREPAQPAVSYGNDRIFVFLSVKGDDRFDETQADLEAAGHPCVKVELDSIDNLGQEFFRWEFATAVAGAVMKINPFNQPDVEAAKIEARKITDEYEKTGKLPDETPFHKDPGFELYTRDEDAATWKGEVENETVANYIRNFVHSDVGPGDYFAILAYVEMNDAHVKILEAFRKKVLESRSVATCLGFGPRFLHSTGQAYKGGGNNGVFLQITSDDEIDIAVPQQKFTFGVVKAAQARGDFQVLLDRERRALRVHITGDVEAGLEKLAGMI